jgi:hypothetical protein
MLDWKADRCGPKPALLKASKGLAEGRLAFGISSASMAGTAWRAHSRILGVNFAIRIAQTADTAFVDGIASQFGISFVVAFLIDVAFFALAVDTTAPRPYKLAALFAIRVRGAIKATNRTAGFNAISLAVRVTEAVFTGTAGGVAFIAKGTVIILCARFPTDALFSTGTAHTPCSPCSTCSTWIRTAT